MKLSEIQMENAGFRKSFVTTRSKPDEGILYNSISRSSTKQQQQHSFSLSLWYIQGHGEHLLFPRINRISPPTQISL